MTRHLKIHSGERSNKCSQCDFASTQAGHLTRHLKTHSGKKSYKCNQCDLASSNAHQLRTHLKIHSGERKKCNQCNYPSSQAGMLFKKSIRNIDFYRFLIDSGTGSPIFCHLKNGTFDKSALFQVTKMRL